MANCLRGGFEMDRKGDWRLKPQVADTIQRDVQAVMAQTGWLRSLARSADHTASFGTTIGGNVSASVSRGGGSPASAQKGATGRSNAVSGGAGGSVGAESMDRGLTSDTATASLDIVNFEVRNAIAIAERIASRSSNPASAFASELASQVVGKEGLRNKYLEQADAARGTFDITAPVTSTEQSSILRTGRMVFDPDGGSGDGDSTFKSRKDQ